MKKNNNISSSANSAIRNNNAILNEGEYIVWTFGDNGDPYNTKKEALAARKEFFGYLYASEAEMDRYIPVHKEIWAREFGLEGNVPVCTYEERLKDIENQSENYYELEDNGFTNREMYNAARNSAIEGVGFYTADLVSLLDVTTFSKAPNGTISCLCNWIDNGATYYEKIDGKWYELNAERAEAVRAELRRQFKEAMKEANRTMNIFNIKTKLEASFEKLDEADYDEIISDNLFGDFELICTHVPTSVDSFMNVELVLSRQGEKKYTTDAFDSWSVGFEIRYDNEIAEVARKISDIIAEADKLLFQKGKTYIGSDGKAYKLVDCTHNWLYVQFGVLVDEDGNEIKGRIGEEASVITLLETETEIRPSGLIED